MIKLYKTDKDMIDDFNVLVLSSDGKQHDMFEPGSTVYKKYGLHIEESDYNLETLFFIREFKNEEEFWGWFIKEYGVEIL